ncbi:MAG: putative peptidoglycan glycosyltransferase FtsW [bacterium]|nr:putative peptidoglycan glycosyltransferase FtsW [bacterium]
MDKQTRKPDVILLSIIAALIFLGILFLASVSSSFGIQKFGDPLYFLSHQVLFGFIPGIFFAISGYLIPVPLLKKFSPILLLSSLLLVALVFVPGIGQQIGGASRWIAIGSLSFQPTELLKLTFILYTASWLSRRQVLVPFQKWHGTGASGKKQEPLWSRITRGKEILLPFLAVLGVISILLLSQPDLSTLGVIGITGIIIYFSALTPIWHTIFLGGGGVGALVLLVMFEPYRLERLITFLNPSTIDPLGSGYQIKQALVGIGSGGITGVGLGMSYQKFGVLPEPISDSIFAVIAEELGFIGATLLVLLFLAFVYRTILLAIRSQDMFSRLTAIGIASWISIQAFVNMGAMLSILPLTGIPLPFISYGGSSLMITLCAMGILLNVSQQNSHA